MASRAWMKARTTLRKMLEVTGKKALTGKKHQKVLDKLSALSAV